MTSRHAVLGLVVVVAVVVGALFLVDEGSGDRPAEAGSAFDERAQVPGDLPNSRLRLRAPALTSGSVALVDVPTGKARVEPALTARQALPPGGSLRGRLVDGAGQPLAGEPVDLLASWDPWAAARPRDAVHDVVDRGVSDADGRFVLGARAGASHALFAGGLRWPRRRVAPVAAGAELVVELREARTLTGTVIAQESGLHVAGARVGAHSGDDRLFTHSDENGWFSLAPLRDDLVVLTGFAVGYDVAVSEPLAADWGPATVELPPGKQLSGAIVDLESEQPVPGASVILRVLTETRPAGEADPLAGRRVVEDYVATSDEQGRYHLDGIPSRGFRVIVEAEGYLPSTSDRHFGRAPDFGEELVIGLVRARDLLGRVDHAGQPVPNTRVVLLGDEQALATTVTDDAGRFSLPTSAWDRIARLAAEARDGEGRTARRPLGAEALGEELLLELVDPLQVEVLVQDGTGPLEGAHVLAASEHALPTTAVTDADGRARLAHPLAGPEVDTVWLQARHGDRRSLATEVSLAGERPAEPVVLDVDDGAWFEGIVQDRFGLPLAGASVSVEDSGRFASTDREGRFALGPVRLADSGTGTLVARAPGHRRQEWPGSAPARDLVLVLEPVVRWGGRASDAATGEPLDRFQGRLLVERRDDGVATWEDLEADVRRVGAPGEFSVELQEAGRYRVRVLSPDHVTGESVATDFDGVRQPPFVDLYLSRAAVLAVQVEDGGGQPVPGYLIWLVPDARAADRTTPAGIAPEGLQRKRTDGNGLARFNLGQGGRLRLASGPGAWLDGGPFDVVPGGVVERRVVVPSLGGLDVAVLDELRQPIAGLGVRLRTVGESRVHSIWRQGTVGKALPLLEVRQLPAGKYELRLTHDEFEPATRALVVAGGRITHLDVELRRAALDASADG